jgi:hypothetical protein
MSPLIKTIDIDVPAAAVITPWQGEVYEILPFDARIFVALLADTGDTFNATVVSGSDVLFMNSQVDEVAIAVPVTFPDDYSLEDLAALGERLTCQLTNLTGAVATVRTALKIDPVIF